MLFRRHDKVVSVILQQTKFWSRKVNVVRRKNLVVHNILKSNAKFIVKVIEEVLLVDKSNTTYFLHYGLCLSSLIGKVSSYSNGKLSSKLLPPVYFCISETRLIGNSFLPKARDCDVLPFCSNQNINILGSNRVIFWVDRDCPAITFRLGLNNIFELNPAINLDAKAKCCLQ